MVVEEATVGEGEGETVDEGKEIEEVVLGEAVVVLVILVVPFLWDLEIIVCIVYWVFFGQFFTAVKTRENIRESSEKEEPNGEGDL